MESHEKKKKRQYTLEFIIKAREKLAQNGGNIEKTARELGVPPSTLRRWRANYRKCVSPFDAVKVALLKNFQSPPHLLLLDSALSALTFGGDESRYLIVSMPPRHGKTLNTSRLFAAWFLGVYPSTRIILASYGADLAKRNSRAIRNLIQSEAFQRHFPGVTLAKANEGARQVASWDIATYGGGVDAVGVGGGITGKGANLIIVDDPIKSRSEAESAVWREKVWSWFNDDLMTRREPQAAVIVVMTRWHQDDLVGRLIREQGLLEAGGRWRYIRLPAIAEADDPLGREQGKALWESCFPLRELRKTESMMGAYAFAGLYQQNPVPSQGGLFKRDQFAWLDDAPSDIVRRVRFWDLALSAKTHADYTVGVLIGKTADQRFILLDVQRFRADWGELVPKLTDVIAGDDIEVVQHVEAAFHHTQAIRDLAAQPALSNRAIFPSKPKGDKWTRALPFAAQAAAGNVYVLRRAWTDAFIEELCSFPYGAHDDQVDSAAGAYLALVQEEDTRRPLSVNTRNY